MTEGPFKNTMSLLTTLSKTPRKRIAFITIKDNRPAPSKWHTIGKVNDWIRRYSKCYYIVRGMTNGIHFHLIAALDKDVDTLRYQKGIHIHVKTLSTNQIFSREDADEIRESRDRREAYVAYSTDHQQSDLTTDQQTVLKCICDAVRRHFRLKTDKVNRNTALSNKQRDINFVMDYLAKNLEEPRDDDVMEYIDWIQRNPD